MSSSPMPGANRDETQVTAANVDLSNCDRELVQYSGAVQPHAVLVNVTEPDLQVVQVSANTRELFGLDAATLPVFNLSVLLGQEVTEQLRQKIASEPLANVPPVHMLRAPIGGRDYHVFAHRIDGVLSLELELASPEGPAADIYSKVRAVISLLQNAKDLSSFFDIAVAEIRGLTGFDRVMAYEFLPDGSGRVCAESVAQGFEPYLGLHYPASDIPKPARRLFSIRWLRHLPDVDYEPVPLVPAMNPVTNAPFDLSYVASRHVSVMYSKYLQNMGVKSTMVMTLLKNGELWGLMSCMHHHSPRYVPHETRVACELLTHMVSTLMAAKEDTQIAGYKLQLNGTMDQLIELAAKEESMTAALVNRVPNLLSAIRAQGAAIVRPDSFASLGNTPGETELRGLADWLAERGDSIFATDRLSELYPPAAMFQNTASGLLACRLSRSGSDFILWFRPEMIETVNWAGDPHKPVEVVNRESETHLLPRNSFAIWKQEVRGRSAPWRDFELEAVRGFRHALLEIVVDRAEKLARLNRELEKSNIELDSFAYVASHDLKEPLRGIHNFSTLIQRSAGERLTDAEKDRLETVLRLTRRMDDLIESLLQYSRVGRMELALQPTDLNEVVWSAIELLRQRIEEHRASVQAAQLPVVRCDRVRLREVFCNLILNGLKYNDSEEKRVFVGYQTGSEPFFYVRDNGIGIAPEHFEDIFKIFRRLHGRDEYGGGTGAGLTIARKTVERHGGRMWVVSTPGSGSTFCFTLPPGPQLDSAEVRQ